MNRLTTKNGYYKITDDTAIRGSRLCGHEFATRFNELSKQFDKVLDKLAAYENTGLEPEEVKQLNASDASKEESSIKYYNEMRKYRDELKYYKKLEEQGLLIKLPCEVGDIFYINIQKKTYECKISGFYIIEDEIQFMIAFPDEDNATWFEVGETHKQEDLFLTREEAEKALKEMEEI